MDEKWSAVSLTVDGDPEYLVYLRDVLGLARGKRSEASSIDFRDARTVGDKVAAAADFVSRHTAELVDPRVSDAIIRVGWTPRSPQDGLFLDVETIAALYRARCSIAIDTYLD